MYLLLRALRQGADKIELTEDFFRSYWNCERPARLYEAYIRNFCHSIGPFFPYWTYGHHNATLYVNKADEVKKYHKSLKERLSPGSLQKSWSKYPELKTETVNSPPDKSRRIYLSRAPSPPNSVLVHRRMRSQYLTSAGQLPPRALPSNSDKSFLKIMSFDR